MCHYVSRGPPFRIVPFCLCWQACRRKESQSRWYSLMAFAPGETSRNWMVLPPNPSSQCRRVQAERWRNQTRQSRVVSLCMHLYIHSNTHACTYTSKHAHMCTHTHFSCFCCLVYLFWKNEKLTWLMKLTENLWVSNNNHSAMFSNVVHSLLYCRGHCVTKGYYLETKWFLNCVVLFR